MGLETMSPRGRGLTGPLMGSMSRLLPWLALIIILQSVESSTSIPSWGEANAIFGEQFVPEGFMVQKMIDNDPFEDDDPITSVDTQKKKVVFKIYDINKEMKERFHPEAALEEFAKKFKNYKGFPGKIKKQHTDCVLGWMQLGKTCRQRTVKCESHCKNLKVPKGPALANWMIEHGQSARPRSMKAECHICVRKSIDICE